MYNKHPKRLEIAEYYLGHQISMRSVAKKFHVHYQSVFKWVKTYRQKGAEGVLDSYKRPWNRISPSLEQRIVALKEADPTLTIRRTKALLREQSINISIKGIWQVWQRFGYAGFSKKRLSNDFVDYCVWTQESRSRFKQARALHRRGDLHTAARILNTIPVLPYNHFLNELPEELCNLPRRVERKSALFGRIPLVQFLDKVRSLYEECMQKNLHHLALRVGLSEIIALSWGIRPDEQLARTRELARILDRRGKYYSNLLFAPRMVLKISEGISLAHRSEIGEALRCARECRHMLMQRSHVPYDFMVHLGTLYNQLENYNEAGECFEKARSFARGSAKRAIDTRLAEIFFLKGKYDIALKVLKKGGAYGWVKQTRGLFYKAMQSFMNGMPGKSIELANRALSIVEKGGLDWGLIKAYNAIASAYLSLGETRKADAAIQRLIAYSRKLKRAETSIETLLGRNISSSLSINRNTLPTTKLAVLLKRGRYMEAYRFAQKKGIMAYLHRFIFYAPGSVLQRLRKGKPTGLPRGILQLPIFNRAMPVYRIHFLGKLVIYKDQHYQKQNIAPKDSALLLHLALRCGEPGLSVAVEDLYRNFWRHTRNPQRNLSHGLYRLRKILKIPSHYLMVRRLQGGYKVMNQGVYFMTDYAELEQKLTTARAFARVGEFEFARTDYVAAFKLVRGLPFQRMYDNWSEDVRRAVLNTIERALDQLNEIPGDQGPGKNIKGFIERMKHIAGHE